MQQIKITADRLINQLQSALPESCIVSDPISIEKAEEGAGEKGARKRGQKKEPDTIYLV